MNSREAKTSGELKDEVLQELRQVNNDIDRMQSRMTPGQIVDDAILRPGHQDPRAVFDHLTANPIGTALLGLGTLLLMEDDGYVSFESNLKSRIHNVSENTRYQYTLAKGMIKTDVEKAEGEVHDLKGRVDTLSTKAHFAVDRVKGKVTDLKNKISKKGEGITGEQSLGDGGELGASSIDEMKTNIGELKTNIGENIGDVKNTVENKLSMVKDEFSNVKDQFGNVRDEIGQLRTTVRDLDPMTIMAIGAGLGALTGISLPVSAAEQSVVDQRLSGSLNGLSGEVQDAINKSTKILKDEFVGKFTGLDVNIFKRNSGNNETFRNEGTAL